MGIRVTLGGWKYAAASVIGTSHGNLPEGLCQDAHAFEYRAHSNTFIGVASDGAGSASLSQIGSRRTCDYVLERLLQAPATLLFEQNFAAEVLDGVKEILASEAEESKVKLREFACTMLVAIVGPERAAFWQIGDGAICFREAGDERFNYVFWPEKGDFANVTFFVTDANAHEHLEFDLTEKSIVELAIFTDGIERLALDFVSGEAHTAFFSGLFPHIRELPEGRSEAMSAQIQTFLRSERINKRTDDDKTLILASRAQ
jgi:hypothetical protein